MFLQNIRNYDLDERKELELACSLLWEFVLPITALNHSVTDKWPQHPLLWCSRISIFSQCLRTHGILMKVFTIYVILAVEHSCIFYLLKNEICVLQLARVPHRVRDQLWLELWLMTPRGSMPHSQLLSNNPYPELNQSSSSYEYPFL